MKNVKKIAVLGMLTALALGLSFAERFIPLGLIIPLPGIKLGLANIVTVAALYFMGPLPALAVVCARCFLGALFGGGFSAFAFSLGGGLLSWAVMSAAARSARISVYGICLLGAAAHNEGQIFIAALVLNSAVFYYLPWLTAAALVTGSVTGAVSAGVLKRLKRTD